MFFRLLPVIVSLVVASFVVACGVDPDGEALLVPNDIHLAWDNTLNQRHDGLGAVIPIDSMVYDAATGEPSQGVSVEFEASHPWAWVIDSSHVVAVEPSDCGDCPLLWDALRDRYYQVSDDAGSALEPLSLTADGDGLVQAYVIVDALPNEPLVIHVATQLSADSFAIIPR